MIGSLNSIQIDFLLRSEKIGRIGCTADGIVYVVPITYVYDGACIIAHTKDGLKTSIMRKNPQVCFEIDHVENLSNWQSVIAWGTYEELTGKAAEDALQLLVNRLHPYSASETIMPRHGLDQPHALHDPAIKPVVFKIVIAEMTGRFEKG